MSYTVDLGTKVQFRNEQGLTLVGEVVDRKQETQTSESSGVTFYNCTIETYKVRYKKIPVIGKYEEEWITAFEIQHVFR